ncbi:hypothetical protein J2125_002565 [Erwinia toletana]|uniref:Uncharacterized protein n=1 Tax=Winslowiella toletana TaxID=92490 RepID=A0ABS4P9S0_9GAMM|nr:hypothetical protein [Winslowiella toletana]
MIKSLIGQFHLVKTASTPHSKPFGAFTKKYETALIQRPLTDEINEIFIKTRYLKTPNTAIPIISLHLFIFLVSAIFI